MLILVKDLRDIFQIKPSSVLHIGAHEMEESDEYTENEFSPVIWIECNPLKITFLKQNVKNSDSIIEACISNENGKKVKFYQAGASSSFYERIGHIDRFPEIKFNESITLTTSRLDSIFDSITIPQFVNIDIEGAEYLALEGLGELLKNINALYLEVTKSYWGPNPDYKQINKFLTKNGFFKLGIKWYWDAGFGDAVYSRNKPSVKTKTKISLYLTLWNFRRLKNFFKIKYLKHFGLKA